MNLNKDEQLSIKNFFIEKGLPLNQALAFNDVILPEYYSSIRSRSELIDFQTPILPDLKLNIPIVSANMESVTGWELAVAIEREGGLAFIPQTLPIQERLAMLEKIGRAECALIDRPLTIRPNIRLARAKKIMGDSKISTLIVTNKYKKPIGILSTRDWLYENDNRKLIRDFMTPKVITAHQNVDFATAARILKKHRIEKLPLVDKRGNLVGLITSRGLFYNHHYPRALRDNKGRFLRIGSIGVGQKFQIQKLKEIEAQLKKGICLLLIDTARAFSINTEETIKKIKKEFSDLPLVVGNVSTAEGVKALCEWGADIIKIGQGPGEVCRTRRVGIGIPQLTAVAQGGVIARRYGKTIIADGGIKSAGDIAKALVAGADAVMLGYLLARTRESASPLFIDDEGRPVKNYIGSASFQAQWQRHQNGTLNRLRRPEGITEVVPVVGTVKEVIDDLIHGLASNMAYLGVRNISELKQKGRFVLQTPAGHWEGAKE